MTSNHKPILLQLEEEGNLGPIPFQFSSLWEENEGFMDVVSNAWHTPVVGSPNYVWEHKLKATKISLKEWIKNPTNSPTSHRN